MHSRVKEQNRRQDQYDILKKEFNFECEKYKKEMAHLTRDLDGCQKELSRLKNGSSKDKEILVIERTNSDKKEAVLKDKINQFEVKNKELMETVKDLTQKYEEVTEDLVHAKAIMNKKIENNEEFEQLKKEVNEHVVETKTVIRERNYDNFSRNKEN